MKREMDVELRKQAKKALEDKRCFTTIASGNTYPIKEELKSWGFFWKLEGKVWVCECASAFQKFLFERNVIDGKWPEVVLDFKEEESILKEGFENGLL